MRSATQRIDAYNARMQSSLIDPTITAVADLAKTNHAEHVAYFYPKQVACRAILDAEAVPGVKVLLYEAYNGELYSVARRYSGTLADAAAQVLHDKYEALGLATAVLVDIAATVWGFTVT